MLRPVLLSSAGSLWPRIASAAVMMPVAMAAIWFGSPWIVLVVAAAAGLMAWEWGRLVGRIVTLNDSVLLVEIAAGAVLVGGFSSPGRGVAVAIVGTILQQIMARGAQRRSAWAALGLLWIILPCVGFVWLRSLWLFGFWISAWLIAVVWSVDIAAYAVGRTVGGPKLAPRISPSKTWSGLIGGVVAAMVAGYVTASIMDFRDRLTITGVSAVLAVVEQLGDMAESYAKRHFGAKDASSLIPGHGGMLDRLDGMLAVAAVMVVLVVSR